MGSEACIGVFSKGEERHHHFIWKRQGIKDIKGQHVARRLSSDSKRSLIMPTDPPFTPLCPLYLSKAGFNLHTKWGLKAIPKGVLKEICKPFPLGAPTSNASLSWETT